MSAAPENNIHHTLVGTHIADGRGDDPAVTDDGGTWTFAQLDQAAARAAGALTAAGVAPGDRVGVVVGDSRAFCQAFLGVVRMGAIAAPLEPSGRNLAKALEALDPALVVAAEDAGTGDHRRLDPSGLDAGDPADVRPVEPDDLAYFIFSSGSTGWPKGVMHAHADLVPSIEGYSTQVLGLRPGDRAFSVAKAFASLGFGNGFFRPLGCGACCVMSSRRPTVRQVLATIAEHGVTVFSAVPTFWSQLARFLARHPDQADLSSVRLAVSSGDSLPAAVLDKVREATGLEVLEGFGCSELSNIIFSVRPGEPAPGTIGRLVPGVEIQLVDEDGEPVEPGTPGRLRVKSASNTTGYWRRPEETAELVHGEWLHLGDTLREEDGVYRHMGRSDDLFKVDGLWVSPTEIEAALHEHPAVGAAAVVAREDENGLTRVAAFFEAAGDDTGPDVESDIRSHVARAMGPYVAPSTITWLDELPRGATGKVDRRALAALEGT